ncbi:hypothetical protein BGW41_006685, partial [Actinomortierella wolfii]
MIRSGGFGSVYRALRAGQPCAAKRCFASHADLSQTDVRREIDILKRLQHRHIIQYFDTIDHDGHAYIVMDLAERGSLAGAIARGEVMDWPTKNRIAHEIARGLQYIHSYDILHRDLKTANVLLTRFMEVKLCDFGLAKVKSLSSSKSTTSFKGTLRWAAPETLELRPQYSTKSDVYALGMVMWAMAANRPEPFDDQHDNGVVIEHVKNGQREQGHTTAQLKLGLLCESNTSANQRTGDSEAIKWYRMAAEGGDSQAQLRFGVIYAHGRGVPQSETEAMHWFERSAAQGNAIAQFNIGLMYSRGQGIDQSDEEAFKWMRQAAEQGMVEAQFGLGSMYNEGRGVEQSAEKASIWYSRAAESGHAAAQFHLGLMYDNGRGVEQSDVEAVTWYRKAADQGYARAQCNLGGMYEYGRGVEQSHVEAVAWFRKAADQGHATAQLNLGLMYANGHGVEQSDVEAAT